MPNVKLGGIISPKKQREEFNRIVYMAMARNGIRTQAHLATLLDMDRAVVNKRLHHGGWSHQEVCRLVRVLKMTAEEAANLLGVKVA